MADAGPNIGSRIGRGVKALKKLVGGLTVGTTTIAGGTTTKVLFDNAGVLGEYTISGSGNVAMTTSPVFTTPALGTPSALVLTNATGTPTSIGLANGTGLPISTGVSGLGTGIATALGVNTGSAGAPVLFNGAGGTPTSLVLTNATALPAAQVVSGALVNGMTATTQAAADNSTKLATTAYVDRGKATAQSSPATPTAPNSTANFTMQGLAGTITPAVSGKILVLITGVVNSASGTSVIADGIFWKPSYGTGSAPANNAALAGTQVGSQGVAIIWAFKAGQTAADYSTPFLASMVVTGLTLGTAYWLDLAAKAFQTASSIGFTDVNISAVEI